MPPAENNILYIFTTSPTGLGHIRVMNALIGGLSTETPRTIVGIKDVNSAKIHAFGSRVKFILKIFEFIQYNDFAEGLFTKIDQLIFRRGRKNLINELSTLVEKFPDNKRWIIVSTHFALAYPAVTIKEHFKDKFGIEIYNLLIVTDDSPQKLWSVNGTDIIFTPSEITAKQLREFLPQFTNTVVKTISFPVAPRLTVKLSSDELALLENQLDPVTRAPLHISVPISGAAVQLEYLETLIKNLSSGQFTFTVIGQNTEFTKTFFDHLKTIPRVQLSIGESAHTTVKLYESAFFQASRPAVEITKPSEQTFKTLIKPSERGGVIMLLTNPVGRQEHDNVNFLVRHSLIPDFAEQEILNRYLLEGTATNDEKNQIHYRASHWRALKLPDTPESAAKYIKRAKEEGILYSMLAYVPEARADLRNDGVAQIWQAAEQMVEYQSDRELNTENIKLNTSINNGFQIPKIPFVSRNKNVH